MTGEFDIGTFRPVLLEEDFDLELACIFSNQIPNTQTQDKVTLSCRLLLLACIFDYQILCTYSTMFGCLIPLRSEISLMAVEGTPSSSFSSLIFLRATNSPVTISLHL